MEIILQNGKKRLLFQTWKQVAEKLVEGVISRFGAPEKIHSYQGQNFEAQLLQEICVLFNMDKNRTSPYNQESDGMVEWMNRTLQDMLAKNVSDHKRHWDVCQLAPPTDNDGLPHSSVHASTQYTPFYLLFGHDMRLPVDVMFGQQPNHKPKVCEEPTGH